MRVKIHGTKRPGSSFAGVAPETVADALSDDGTLTATVTLTDAKGGPTCASVPETLIRWSAKR